MSNYRIYIDEVGDDGMDPVQIQHPRNRYLSLSGVILESEYYNQFFHPLLFEMKSKFIPDYPDDPRGKSFCLHRKDILKKQNGFEFLNDVEICKQFDAALLSIVEKTEYHLITAVIDKYEHYRIYGSLCYHPYYYSLKAILERYVRFLERNNSKGDVVIEARNKNKDRELKRIFEEFYDDGSDFIKPNRIQAVFTSKQIKIKPKEKNVYGLQLADIVAYPSYAGMKQQKFKQPETGHTFGNKIFNILNRDKYYRVDNKIWGVGKKWLP